jgi:CRISPR/Cas system CMR-associated protein Cmr1 (group 7 of RAMP superfamily)
MTKERLISFETANLAKQNECNIKCKNYFEDLTDCIFSGENKEDSIFDCKFDHPNIYARPTQSELQLWFREHEQIFIEINTDCTTEPKFCFSIDKFIGNPLDLSEREWSWYHHKDVIFYLYRSYEDALEEALKESFKIINI